jgi:hypothetical protein
MPRGSPTDKFLAKYTPEIARQLKAAREHLALHFPRGFELVYDNYNALVFAYATSERASDAVLSVAGYPKWVTLFFANATTLSDPSNILEGSGSKFKSVRLLPASRLLEPAVQELINAAKAAVAAELEAAPLLSTIVKSVSAKQRPRMPLAEKSTSSAKRTWRGASGA